MTVRYFTHYETGCVVTRAVRDQTQFQFGLLFALSSAFFFSVSGPLAKSLMEAGWSATAAVTARMACGAIALAVFATAVHPGWFSEMCRHVRVIAIYGLIPVAGAQLCYYNAVAHLPVGVAILLEYTAPILVIAWIWATTRIRPSGLTLVGVGLAITGITLVLNIFSEASPTASHSDPSSIVGVVWAMGAALSAAFYFMMSAKVTTGNTASDSAAEGTGLHPITLATGGLVTGAIAVALLGISGILPMEFTTNDVALAGFTVPWTVPVILLGILPTAVAYALGIAGVCRLRPSFASLMGLCEVLFTVLASWLVLDESVSTTQAIGGAVVLLGLTLARLGEPDNTVATEETTGSELASHL